ncbi:MAG: HAMP domain-containing sensor histidine kinase [Acidobacteriota bacterium]|nr:HAMP domain-containing sensor histidine kinase [Acidobacteriota bacterium]
MMPATNGVWEAPAVLSFAVRLLLGEGERDGLLERGVEALQEFSRARGVALYLVEATTLQCLTILQAILAVGLQNARTIDDLREAHRETANLYEANGKLIQHLSHELKTPLALIVASAKLLERPTIRADDARHAKVMDRVRRSVERLEQIQQEAQDIARPPPESGVERSRETVALLQAVEGVLTDIQPLHSHRDVTIEAELEKCPSVRVPVQPRRRSITGLVRKAIEATADGGRVRVRSSDDGDCVRLAVEDCGVGMSADTLEQIFFGFVHAGRTEGYLTGGPYDFGAGGVGLDRLRTKQLADRFGFHVEASSEPGVGSRFTLAFPPALWEADGS